MADRPDSYAGLHAFYMYAVNGYPTKIVLDPEGRILKTVIGESPEFYTHIDSLMK